MSVGLCLKRSPNGYLDENSWLLGVISWCFTVFYDLSTKVVVGAPLLYSLQLSLKAGSPAKCGKIPSFFPWFPQTSIMIFPWDFHSLPASTHTIKVGLSKKSERWVFGYNQLLFKVYLIHITLSNIGRTFSWTKHDQIHTILLIVFIPRTFQAEITSIFLDLVCEAVRLPYPARREPWAHLEFRPRFVLAVWILYPVSHFPVFFFHVYYKEAPRWPKLSLSDDSHRRFACKTDHDPCQ